MANRRRRLGAVLALLALTSAVPAVGAGLPSGAHGAAKAARFPAAINRVMALESTGKRSAPVIRRIAAALYPYLGRPRADIYYVGLLLKAAGPVGHFSPKKARQIARYEYRRLMNRSANAGADRRMADIYATLVEAGFKRGLLRADSPMQKPRWALRAARASGQRADAIRAHELADKALAKKGLSLAQKQSLAELRLAADRLIGAKRALLYPETLAYSDWLYRQSQHGHAPLRSKSRALLTRLIGDHYALARLERVKREVTHGAGASDTGALRAALHGVNALLHTPGLRPSLYRGALSQAVRLGDHLVGARVLDKQGHPTGHRAKSLRLLALTDNAVYLVTKKPSVLRRVVVAAVVLRLALTDKGTSSAARNPFRLSLVEFGCQSQSIYLVSAYQGHAGKMLAHQVADNRNRLKKAAIPGLVRYRKRVCAALFPHPGKPSTHKR